MSTLRIEKLISEMTATKARKGPPPTGDVVSEAAPSKNVASHMPRPPTRSVPHPDAVPVLARPHPQLSGRRHVPKLVTANGVPFLRFKKPQSAFLSRVIRDKLGQRQKYFERLQALEQQAELAALEDRWDRVLFRMHGARDREDTAEADWTEELELSIRDTMQRLAKQDKANVAMAARMQEIVDREKELAEAEKMQRKDQKSRGYAIRVSGEEDSIHSSL